MEGNASGAVRRILIVDDNPAIHQDFRKIFGRRLVTASALTVSEAALFGTTAPESPPRAPFKFESAFQGQQALELVRQSVQQGNPYAMAFVDVRMPPGWDGIETINRLWEIDSDVHIVICTAYSDYSWEELLGKLEAYSERFLILKKPFDHVEVRQLATSLARKWSLARQARARVDELEALVGQRTRAIREAHERLQAKLKQALKQQRCPVHGHECHEGLFGRNLYAGQRIPLAGVAHQNGTIRFGHDPKTSALDVNCRAHDLDNLYVVDGSFFPSSAAVNPALTIMANALRVGDHILDRLGATARDSVRQPVEVGSPS